MAVWKQRGGSVWDCPILLGPTILPMEGTSIPQSVVRTSRFQGGSFRIV